MYLGKLTLQSYLQVEQRRESASITSVFTMSASFCVMSGYVAENTGHQPHELLMEDDEAGQAL
jgi:hypothetical protein